jgi:hypothetical protein
MRYAFVLVSIIAVWTGLLLIAILEREAEHYSARGTSHEKYIKKEVNNIKKFI